MRVGPPEDDGPDYLLPVWAGVIPLSLAPGSRSGTRSATPRFPRPPTQPVQAVSLSEFTPATIKPIAGIAALEALDISRRND